MAKTVVIATFNVIGYHKWAEAPVEVQYLCNEHRHEFNFRVEVQVGHDDRETEFHILKRHSVLSLLSRYEHNADSREVEFGGSSCEMIAKELHAALTDRGYAIRAIEVWEDAENGARVEFEVVS